MWGSAVQLLSSSIERRKRWVLYTELSDKIVVMMAWGVTKFYLHDSRDINVNFHW